MFNLDFPAITPSSHLVAFGNGDDVLPFNQRSFGQGDSSLQLPIQVQHGTIPIPAETCYLDIGSL